MIREFIVQSLEEIFSSGEFSDCFLVEIHLSGDGTKIQIFVDSDSALTIEKCIKISRLLERNLDDENYLEGKYVLEVSSPGVERPLVYFRQFRKHIGRKFKIATIDGAIWKGKLVDLKGNSLILEYALPKKEAKSRGIKAEILELDFERIKEAKIKISFK